MWTCELPARKTGDRLTIARRGGVVVTATPSVCQRRFFERFARLPMLTDLSAVVRADPKGKLRLGSTRGGLAIDDGGRIRSGDGDRSRRGPVIGSEEGSGCRICRSSASVGSRVRTDLEGAEAIGRDIVSSEGTSWCE